MPGTLHHAPADYVTKRAKRTLLRQMKAVNPMTIIGDNPYIRSQNRDEYTVVAEAIKIFDANPPVKLGGIERRLHAELNYYKKCQRHFDIIANMADDWDDDGALAPKRNVYEAAFRFVFEYVAFVHEDYMERLSLPSISVMRNGSIDVFWRTVNAELLVNIRQDKNRVRAFYSAEVFCKDGNEPGPPIKGWVYANENDEVKPATGRIDLVDETLANWMTNIKLVD